ncbi:ABC transporter ATP-binding protein [Virgibacillus sp. DJP39]|uniref:ABC transporter ATP-binding protein n=1 Tax=Virgibacillus sp. DJP39 TaxID=3409790 RepID=UPI003BB48A98
MTFLVKDVSVNGIIKINELAISDNKVTCIVGKSGSGKSTFLRLLNNLDNPDSGIIYYRNNDIQTIDPIELRKIVTMVPQTPVIYQGTIKDNLLVGIQFSGVESVSDSSMNKILKQIKLSKPLDTIADELSGGEKQRLALARSMLLNAEVFLLDEPTSSLDDETASDVIAAFTDHMREQQKTIIMVTHDNDLAEKISDNIIQMDAYSI